MAVSNIGGLVLVAPKARIIVYLGLFWGHENSHAGNLPNLPCHIQEPEPRDSWDVVPLRFTNSCPGLLCGLHGFGEAISTLGDVLVDLVAQNVLCWEALTERPIQGDMREHKRFKICEDIADCRGLRIRPELP